MVALRRSVAALATLLGLVAGDVGTAGSPRARLGRIDLPDAWERQFWESPDVRAVLALEPAELAKLVPTQAGLHFCGCPSCGATEADDPLRWSPSRPEVVTCRRCEASFPSDKVPAKVEPAPGKPPAVPEETVEVRPGVVHRYPYHLAEPTRQKYPDERFYLAAKRDDEVRRFLAKVVLYAAVRSFERQEPHLAKPACVLLLRFSQVYPDYATHFDTPGRPKTLQPADLRPPYRRGYGTAKWDHSGALEVPLNLAIAYDLLRDSPAMAEAGRLLGESAPGRTIEEDLFRAAANFLRGQPDEPGEAALYVVRGLLTIGRLLDDAALMDEGSSRLETLARHDFFHDGVWRDGRASSQQRVVALLDGWINRLLPDERRDDQPAVLSLARNVPAGGDPPTPGTDVLLASWPAPAPSVTPRGPRLLGGAGIVRLAAGEGPGAIDLELRGVGDDGLRPNARLALRLNIGGQGVLGDLDDLPPRSDGLDRATASHNAVLIDGLNQRETARLSAQTAAGAEVLFFAADDDFQVAVMDDPRAYPISASRYRHLVLASSGPLGAYAVSIAEVAGGLQHDQLFAAAAGNPGRWQLAAAMRPGPRSLLAPTVLYLPTARAEDGRWFVQALGSISDLSHGPLDAPTAATLGDGPRSLRVHLLGDAPSTAFLGAAPGAANDSRAVMALRRTSSEGQTLTSHFVTLFEPGGTTRPGRLAVGRVEAPPGVVALVVSGQGVEEHLVINLHPGTSRATRLADGRRLATDGVAVRVRGEDLVLAGGSFAELGSLRREQPAAEGTVVLATHDPQGRGVFETDAAIPDAPDLIGRTLLIQHGDGTTRGWTIAQVEPLTDGTRFLVNEAPGFRLDHRTGEARYEQFPRTSHPGPHTLKVARIAR
jgi:hypothetical protein